MKDVCGLAPAEVWNGESIHSVNRKYGQGRWVQALDGLLLGYRLRR